MVFATSVASMYVYMYVMHPLDMNVFASKISHTYPCTTHTLVRVI